MQRASLVNIFYHMTSTPNPATQLAYALRTAFADAAPRAHVLAGLVALILAQLDAVLLRLESLFAAWQAGTMRAPPASHHTARGAPPETLPRPHCQTALLAVARTRAPAGRARLQSVDTAPFWPAPGLPAPARRRRSCSPRCPRGPRPSTFPARQPGPSRRPVQFSRPRRMRRPPAKLFRLHIIPN